MRPVFVLPLCIAVTVLTSGCIARTVLDVVTAPVKLVSKAADVATTSQSEADEKRGREVRKREEELGKLDRAYEKQLKKCENGDQDACADARETYDEMRRLSLGVALEPERR